MHGHMLKCLTVPESLVAVSRSTKTQCLNSIRLLLKLWGSLVEGGKVQERLTMQGQMLDCFTMPESLVNVSQLNKNPITL
jgi:hypothetical protein